jgi:hypothetical protein
MCLKLVGFELLGSLCCFAYDNGGDNSHALREVR